MIDQTPAFFHLEGVYVSALANEKYRMFEQEYLAIRSKEHRVMSDDLVRSLPRLPASHPDYDHWKTRRFNIDRFVRYLTPKKQLNILEVGTGNGFLSNLMAQKGHTVTGLDVNLHELKQAARIFSDQNIRWYCADVFEDVLPGPFDLIVFCCSIQYFKDVSALIRRCKSLLAANGEIHIIDTPFYDERSVVDAKNRSKEYFEKHETAGMASHYFHHTWSDLNKFAPEILYRPTWINRFKKDSPFCWIRIS
jgi:2-polyprenyl-3-methyl-5-hydroxy-6-metoxy-1,4-benzoquinol methylase